MTRNLAWLVWTALALGLAGCGTAEGDLDAAIGKVLDPIPRDRWESLQKDTIYFGHQSVGYDIMNGVGDLEASRPGIGLRVTETSDLGAAEACFAHSKNGENEHPDTKIRAFEATLRDATRTPDIAFFKFCYVDITADTDVKALFESYRSAMERLKSDHPSTVFVHLTSPLTTVETGPKAWVKRVIGRPLGGVAHNIRRLEFNDLLLREYGGREPVFDLAKWEATRVDGSQETFGKDGGEYLALVPGYSYDGKHLNERGRRWVAAHLLAFLAELPSRGGADPA